MDFWFTVAVFVSSLRGAERRPSPWKQRSGSADVVWLQSEITRSRDTPEVTHRSLRCLLSCRKTARSEPEVRRTLFFKQPRHDSWVYGMHMNAPRCSWFCPRRSQFSEVRHQTYQRAAWFIATRKWRGVALRWCNGRVDDDSPSSRLLKTVTWSTGDTRERGSVGGGKDGEGRRGKTKTTKKKTDGWTWTRRRRVTWRGGVPWNFLLALPFCRSSWCHYSCRLREFEAPAEQIGQSARIIRRKLC